MLSTSVPTPEWFASRESVIESVHTLPDYPVEYAPSIARVRYVGKYATADADIDRIYVSRYSENPNLTFAHETGHRVEMRGLATKKVNAVSDLPSWGDPDLIDWMKAINSSKAFTKMSEAYQEAIDDEDTAIIRVIEYNMRPQELWARSYAQYIAVKSQDTEMLEELAQMQYLNRSGFRLPTQWLNKDFEPIIKAIDDLFVRKGWIP